MLMQLRSYPFLNAMTQWSDGSMIQFFLSLWCVSILFYMFQGGLYRSQHYAQAYINQVNAGQGDDYASLDHNTCVEHMIENIQQ